jgi:DNA-binding response OmpR family regulator
MVDTASGRSVLIVEDDQSFAGLLASHLEARGYSVQRVASAEEAGGLIRAGFRPDIVVLDINLPGDSGWGLLRSGTLGAAIAPPVVVISAMPMSPARLTEFHVAGYLPKPFAMTTLMSTIERLLHEETAVHD